MKENYISEHGWRDPVSGIRDPILRDLRTLSWKRIPDPRPAGSRIPDDGSRLRRGYRRMTTPAVKVM
jgi:hypothetical protein